MFFYHAVKIVHKKQQLRRGFAMTRIKNVFRSHQIISYCNNSYKPVVLHYCYNNTGLAKCLA
jgi:hypothetical protein